MGGITMLIALLIAVLPLLIYLNQFTMEAILLLITLTGFSLLGFYDDYQKVTKKHNKGITGWTKLAVQGGLSLVLLVYLTYFMQDMQLSLFGIMSVNMSYFLIPFGILVIMGSSNAINLTDGLDGLASGTSAVAFLTLSFFLYKTGYFALALIAASIGGACLGFIFYNRHPAKIFMGDSGSLMLGGAFGALGVLGRLEMWLIPIGFIFVIEALSVIIQVISFKTTGKRVFKMSPLHHHYELSGFSETAVVRIFTITQAVCCLMAIFAGYLFVF